MKTRVQYNQTSVLRHAYESGMFNSLCPISDIADKGYEWNIRYRRLKD